MLTFACAWYVEAWSKLAKSSELSATAACRAVVVDACLLTLICASWKQGHTGLRFDHSKATKFFNSTNKTVLSSRGAQTDDVDRNGVDA